MGKGKSTKNPHDPKLLTKVELEIMGHIWRLGEASVADVILALPEERKLAYTSVSTMMRILESKGAVGSRKEGRGHVYFPLVAKEKYEAASLKSLVSQVFDGAPVTLVRRLLDEESLSREDLEALRELLEERLKS